MHPQQIPDGLSKPIRAESEPARLKILQLRELKPIGQEVSPTLSHQPNSSENGESLVLAKETQQPQPTRKWEFWVWKMDRLLDSVI